MSTLDYNCFIEEDNVSDITIDENDFTEPTYLYFNGKNIENIYIKVECFDKNNRYGYLDISQKNKFRNMNIKIRDDDNNIMDVIVKLFFLHFPTTLFHSNELISKTIFKNYINSIKDNFIIKRNKLIIKIVFGKWIKDIKNCNSFFWIKKKKVLYKNEK